VQIDQTLDLSDAINFLTTQCETIAYEK
jgi:hypothetical protein